MNDEYELLSHEEIEQLKKEAERHKNNPFIKNNSDDKLYSAIVDLNKSINRMTSVFQDVKQQIIQEQETGQGPDAKMDVLLEQNKHIAQALVSFGDKLEDLQPKNEISEDEDELNEFNDAETNSNNANMFNDSNNNQSPQPPITPTQPSNFQGQQPDLNASNSNFQSQQPNLNTQTQTNHAPQQNDSATNKQTDLDYQTWNYSRTNKPGVSQSKANNDVPQQNPAFQQQSFAQPNQFGTQQTNQGNNQQTNNLGQFPSPEQAPQQNSQFPQPPVPNQEQQGFNQSNQLDIQHDDPWSYQQDKGFGQFPSPGQAPQQNQSFAQNPQNNTNQPNMGQPQNSQMPNLKPLPGEKPPEKKKRFGLF